jgi:hypothetical protein
LRDGAIVASVSIIFIFVLVFVRIVLTEPKLTRKYQRFDGQLYVAQSSSESWQTLTP